MQQCSENVGVMPESDRHWEKVRIRSEGKIQTVILNFFSTFRFDFLINVVITMYHV